MALAGRTADRATTLDAPRLAVERDGWRAGTGRWRRAALVAAAVAALLAPDGVVAASSGGPTVEQYATHVGGQIVPYGELVIDGTRLSCGRRPTVLDSTLDDYGAAYPGFLILNPRLLARVPKPVKLWIYSHECGHQFRGPDEARADCFAVQRGRRQRWLTTDGLEQVCQFIRPAKGSRMHYSGPQRCELMKRCYVSNEVY